MDKLNRILAQREIRQRGCLYCKDRVKEKTCPFDKCPYKELDDIGNYEIETAKLIELVEGEDED